MTRGTLYPWASSAQRLASRSTIATSSIPSCPANIGKCKSAATLPQPIKATRTRPTESRFRDVEVPTALLRRAINGASTDKGELEYSELMSYLRAKGISFDGQTRIVIDYALADSVSENLPERASIQIRAYDLDDPQAATIRSKIRTLPANAQAVLLTPRR